MMKSGFSTYAIYQITGWGVFFFINVFFAITFDKFNLNYISRLCIFVGLGVVFSHIMRYAIIHSNVLMKQLRHQLIGFIIITFVFALFVGSLMTVFTRSLKNRSARESNLTEPELLLSDIFYSFVYLFIWNCIYFIYHYIQKNRKQQLDTLKLEALVKELELKTIKSHINPHFIFNALNSIRALIDENPERARTAITELSNILRSSMQADKSETVPLSRELDIVKDYLALEYIRFEHRLKIEYDIDDETLDLPVPPMMLQTLVENAIKHGISKLLEGGIVKITSSFHDEYHELTVQNTGILNKVINTNGFGIASTHNRLQLIFGEKAHFEIKEVWGNMVEAKIQIPVSITYA